MPSHGFSTSFSGDITLVSMTSTSGYACISVSTRSSEQLSLLQPEWPDIHESAVKAERVYPDPRTSCFYARRAWNSPCRGSTNTTRAALAVSGPPERPDSRTDFRQTVGDAVFNKARVIKDLGNLAVHSQRPVRQFDALTATKELFHLCYWLAHTYSRGAKPAAGLTFDPASVRSARDRSRSDADR